MRPRSPFCPAGQARVRIFNRQRRDDHGASAATTVSPINRLPSRSHASLNASERLPLQRCHHTSTLKPNGRATSLLERRLSFATFLATNRDFPAATVPTQSTPRPGVRTRWTRRIASLGTSVATGVGRARVASGRGSVCGIHHSTLLASQQRSRDRPKSAHVLLNAGRVHSHTRQRSPARIPWRVDCIA